VEVKVNMRRARTLPAVKPVCVLLHPSFYNKMELYRKEYKDKKGINLSQVQITNLMAKRIRVPNLKEIDLIGGKYVLKKKR